MKTLEHQLVDYGNRLRELHGPISAEELTVRPGQVDQTAPVQPIHPMPQTSSFRRPQGWLVAAGAAAAVFVLVGATALLSEGTETGRPVTESSSIVSSSSSLVWSRVPYDEAVFGGNGDQLMSGVTVGGPGFVAVGSDGDDAAVWTSIDGITWSQVRHDEAVFGGGHIRGVAVGGPGLVAVGSNHGEAAVWTSVDGVAWSRVPNDESGFSGAVSSIRGVTAGGPGLVAVGSIVHQHEQSESMSGAVWTSVDGVAWSRVPDDYLVFGATPLNVGGTEMSGVTAASHGLVAVGWHRHDASAGAFVWLSSDGITWSQIPHDNTVFGGATVSGVTAASHGLVAVGSDRDGAAVWTSADGLTWSRVPLDTAGLRGAKSPQVLGVTSGGPGLVAVGSEWSDGDIHAAVWVARLDIDR